jgi:peptide/nickel transport system substrate-binding protein
MKRRTFLAAAAAGLAMPAVVRAQGTPGSSALLKFIPQSDLTVLDPHWTTAYVTRNHAFMVFDTLYGTNGTYEPSPQMVAGHTVDDDGKLWRLTLRDGLLWHDGTPVLARDCVASIKRWGKKDGFGQALLAATGALSADGDKVIVFRLKQPFPLLPAALGKNTVYMPAMMPERLALTDPNTQVQEMVGSGPFRFVAKERVPGSLAVYEKFAGYVPLPSGTPDWTAGPKVVHFDRVEWHTTPDPATAAAALQSGETDWWDYATADLLPLLRRARGVKVAVQDPTGQIAIMRMNQLQPPFDNPGIRRALLGAVDQSDFMQAVVGTDPALWHDKVGVFCPGTPLANDAGMAVLDGPRDMGRVKADLAAAGYKGERVVLLVATDFPVLKALADVGADMMTRAGMNVDYQALDWGTVLTRRTSKAPVDHGGWSCFFTAWAGSDMLTPAGHISLRGNGQDAWFGWPNAPKIEALRQEWFAAPDAAAQKKVAEALQQQVLTDVPYVPLGQYLQATAYRDSLRGVLDGFAIFWNVAQVL